MSKLMQVAVLFSFTSVDECTQFIYPFCWWTFWGIWGWYVGYDLLMAQKKWSTLELKGEYSLRIKREKYFRNVREKNATLQKHWSLNSVHRILVFQGPRNIPAGYCQILPENWEEGGDLRWQLASPFFRSGGTEALWGWGTQSLGAHDSIKSTSCFWPSV